MICKHCHRCVKSTDSLKCSLCEARYHTRCVNEPQEVRDGGDVGYQWRCAKCPPLSISPSQLRNNNRGELFNAIDLLTEKFELINKFQLPKLSTELSQIKSITDQIVKQNEEIISRIDNIDKRKNVTLKQLRKRSINLGPRNISLSHYKIKDDNDRTPILPESPPRIRVRRRSHDFNKMLHLLNKNITRANPRSCSKKDIEDEHL